jgi:hypothetical protein
MRSQHFAPSNNVLKANSVCEQTEQRREQVLKLILLSNLSAILIGYELRIKRELNVPETISLCLLVLKANVRPVGCSFSVSK